MKINLLVSLLILLAISLYGQETNDKKEESSKMESFVSKTGVIIKYIDYKLPDLKTSYAVAETRIRKIYSGDEARNFYQISKKNQYNTRTASIAYKDLVEVIKALTSLKNESQSDLVLNPDYLENKFITDDGFNIGYYVSAGKLVWYMTLEKYGSDNILYFKELADIELAVNFAKQKMEE